MDPRVEFIVESLLRGRRGRPVQAARSGGRAIGQCVELRTRPGGSGNGSPLQNPDVIDLVMRGAEALWRFQQQPTKDSNIAIRALFEQALKIDPNDPDALNGDASTYLTGYAFGWANPQTDYDAKTLGQADRAIALAHGTLRAYSTKSVYLTNSGRPKEGLRVAEAALAINPNYAAEYSYRALAETALGQFEQAKSDLQQAMRLSPLDPRMGAFHDKLAWAELGLGHFDAAIEESSKAIDAAFKAFSLTSIWPPRTRSKATSTRRRRC